CIAEAEQTANEGLIQDVTSVLDAAEPADEKRRSWANRFAAEVYENLETIISSAQQSDDAGTGAKRSCEVGSLSVEPALKRAKTVGGMTPATSPSFQASEQTAPVSHSQLIQWISFQSSLEDPSTPASHGPEIQLGISALVGFVGQAIAGMAADIPCYYSMRKLSTFQKVESIATDDDSYQQLDIALTMDANTVPDHKDMLMMVAVKQFAQEQHRAYRYLAYRTCKLFTTQPNRRFAWGLTVCATTVRACLFVHDKVLSSEAMDVSTSDGRKTFVTLLTNWSMCESWQLGYDPTIRYDADLKHWGIDVYNGGTQLTRSYICENICCNAYSTFGRHTRCFVAHEKPTDLARASDQDFPKVLIKDAWARPISPGSDIVCDEVAYLREIRDALADNNTLDGTYPLLEAGGVVQITCPNGVADDNTQLMLKDIDENTRAKVPARIHRRIVMSPVGEPIHNLKSIDELIVVVGDVMAAHTAIAKRCGLLHRDLSVNNIMFHRDKDGVRGMLIDFDNACRITDMEKTEQPDCVGTLPFMSIGNLELSNVKRTILDDWESLIYILCWLAQPEVPAPSDTQFLDRNVDPAITDSFARRAEIANALADELLE
ncbi:hypothetical protein LPJ76_006327, partial [Coemansia sp. RSA 638]